MDSQRFNEKRSNSHPRIKTPSRILEDHLHLLPQVAQLPALKLRKFGPFKRHTSTGGTNQLQDRSSHSRLSATAFSHNSERLAPIERNRDVIHSSNDLTLPHGKVHNNISRT